MTIDPNTPENQSQEQALVIKLPEGYKPTNTEMIIRGAGVQSENKDKPLQT